MAKVKVKVKVKKMAAETKINSHGMIFAEWTDGRTEERKEGRKEGNPLSEGRKVQLGCFCFAGRQKESLVNKIIVQDLFIFFNFFIFSSPCKRARNGQE